MRVAVILAGCGRFDGSEIHESVLTLLSIEQNQASWSCFSLDGDQNHVTNHLTDKIEVNETRNMLVESARIARGNVKKLQELNVNDFAALIIPGGNGTAYNLFNLATAGADYVVDPLVKQKCLEFTNANKPVGFICIAPVMIPAIYSDKIELTIGLDIEMAKMLESRGAQHVKCRVDEIHIDKKHKIVTTPAYMLAHGVLEAYSGIKKLVDNVVLLAS